MTNHTDAQATSADTDRTPKPTATDADTDADANTDADYADDDTDVDADTAAEAVSLQRSWWALRGDSSMREDALTFAASFAEFLASARRALRPSDRCVGCFDPELPAASA